MSTLRKNRLVKQVIRPLVKRTLALFFGARGIKINLARRYPVRLHPDFYFSGYESFGERHNHGYSACIEACRPCKTFLDIGGHVGLYTLPIAKLLGAQGKVFVFEPGMRNYRYLKYHLEINNLKNVELLSVAFGEQEGQMLFFENKADFSGLNSCVTPLKNPDQFDERSIEVTTLDRFCDRFKIVPDIMKIDVEGAELAVLRGGANSLKKYSPQIFLSVHPEHLEVLGHSISELESCICDLGYQAFDISMEPVDSLSFGEFILEKSSRQEQ